MTVPAPIDVRVYRFKPDGLDPITVYVEQYGETQSRIIVRCWDKAWTAYWGAHGDKGLESFILSANTGYVVDYLLQGWEYSLLRKYEPLIRQYTSRIVEAIKAEFAKGAK